jgi:hypothetical protein
MIPPPQNRNSHSDFYFDFSLSLYHYDCYDRPNYDTSPAAIDAYPTSVVVAAVPSVLAAVGYPSFWSK